jgi:Ca-activated chloride channel family protein
MTPLAITFAEPAVLPGLILVPLAALAYSAMQARRRREAAAFANPALMPNVVTGRPGWRRHLAPLLILLALAALILAAARPQRSVAAPQRAATVMLVMDTSGSMRANDVDPDRLSAARKSARSLVDKLPAPFRVGLVTFSDFAEQQAAPSTDRSPVKDALNRMVADGGTAMGDAIARGLRSARVPVPRPDGKGTRVLPAVLVLLSDGANNAGALRPEDAAQEARRLHIPIFTIALGTEGGVIVETNPFGFTRSRPVPPDKATLREVARSTGGRYFEAPTAKDLQSIYNRLGTRLSAKQVKHEVTWGFAAGGLALLIAGGAMSLAWFGRVPA